MSDDIKIGDQFYKDKEMPLAPFNHTSAKELYIRLSNGDKLIHTEYSTPQLDGTWDIKIVKAEAR